MAKAGATILRGGTYKPRSSPYSFQGLGQEGLSFLAEARKQTKLPVVSEILDARDIGYFLEHADIIQIGAKAMYDQGILRACERLSTGSFKSLEAGDVDASNVSDRDRVFELDLNPLVFASSFQTKVRVSEVFVSATSTVRRSVFTVHEDCWERFVRILEAAARIPITSRSVPAPLGACVSVELCPRSTEVVVGMCGRPRAPRAAPRH